MTYNPTLPRWCQAPQFDEDYVEPVADDHCAHCVVYYDERSAQFDDGSNEHMYWQLRDKCDCYIEMSGG